MENNGLVKTLKQGQIVYDIYEKYNHHTDKYYYDLVISREYTLIDEEGCSHVKRSQYLQQRDLWDAQILNVEAQRWISDQHRKRVRNLD
jgi:hypothetical protein